MRVAHGVELFVERKQYCGYGYGGPGKVLRRFARFTGKKNLADIEDADVNAFLWHGSIANNTWRSYCSILGMFFRYWYARGQIGRVPTPHNKPSMPKSFSPYVYTRAEIHALLDAIAVDQRHRICEIGDATLRAVILVLYGTGMRINEALSLRRVDVDLRKHMIRIRDTSIVNRREIPIGRDVTSVLSRYLTSAKRNRLGEESHLFLTRKGSAVRYDRLCEAFFRIRKIAEIKRRIGLMQPGLRDLRHTFAIHSIAQWSGDVAVLDRMLPILATYMGRIDMRGSEKYLPLAPNSYQAQLDKM
jgi:integrase/recombinase XerD